MGREWEEDMMTEKQILLIMEDWDFKNAIKLSQIFFKKYPAPYTKEQVFDFLGL